VPTASYVAPLLAQHCLPALSVRFGVQAGANRQGSMKMTKRNRRRLMVAETAQLAAVLAHPSFQANPLGTIHDHLENSIRLANASSQ
jgi:hypothetical protein